MQVRKRQVHNKVSDDWNQLNKQFVCVFLLFVKLNHIIIHKYFFNVTEGSARKGRTKKEASDNTNRHNPAGHERKIVEKLQNSDKKDKEWILRYKLFMFICDKCAEFKTGS